MEDRNDFAGLLLSKKWDVPCVQMKVVQNAASEPATFFGKGHLYQDTDGTILFRLFPTEFANHNCLKFWPDKLVPGKLFPDNSYYSLEATDWYGRRWKWHRILPHIPSSFCNEKPEVLVEGRLDEIRFDEDRSFRDNRNYLTMHFFVDAKVPAISVTETFTHFDGALRFSASALDHAQLNTDFGEFVVRTESGKLIVECESDKPFPDHFPLRVSESLSFILARRLYWNVLDVCADGKRQVKLRGQKGSDPKSASPPMADNHPNSPRWLWAMFTDYLNFVSKYTEPKFHPCTRHLFSIYQAYQGTLEAKTLALSVAVEGLVKDLYPQKGQEKAQIKKVVRQLRQHCEAWEGFRDEDIKRQLGDRLSGILGQLTTQRPKDTLFQLMNEKLVEKLHIDAWAKLRNLAAHGEYLGSLTTQEIVDLIHVVEVLVYRLILKAIRYEGLFTDYASQFRCKVFRGRPVRDDEKAFAAYLQWEKDGKLDGRDLKHWFDSERQLEQGWI